MSNPRKFILWLALSFGFPWLLLVVVPAIRYQGLTPQAYNKDADGIEGVYPGSSNQYHDGARIYAREGCVQCHTQMIRPSFAGIGDGWKKGWGSDQSPIPKTFVRPSTAWDYLGERVALLGVQRNGPDLANAGYRYLDKDGIADRNAVHVQLYAPKAVAQWSVMPSFRHLYKVRPIEGNGARNALKLPEKFAPKKDFEVVPTPEAEELVNYLLALKKDAPVPGSQVVAEAAPKK